MENQPLKSRYTPALLVNAYKGIQPFGSSEDVGVMDFPLGCPDSDCIEVYYNAQRKEADALLNELFAVLYLVDEMVQEGDINNYDVAYFDVSENKVMVGYWGTKVNTSFDVILFREDGEWYLAGQGMLKYDPPVKI